MTEAGVAAGPQRRVAITGLGTISSIGIGVTEFVRSLRTGRVGTGPIRSFDTTGFPSLVAAEVTDFEPAEGVRVLDPRRWGRSSLFAAGAARLAVEDSGIDPDLLSRSVSGCIMGTTAGEAVPMQDLAGQWVKEGLAQLDPRLVVQAPASQIAVAVSRELGLTGDTHTVPTACSASNFALGHAYDLVRTGEADFMVAGGADSVNRNTHAGFYRLGALAEAVTRPFDVDRSGILTGEGGVALLLEPLEGALARGAHVYAEVLGWAMNCDAEHMVQPDATGIAECIRLAHRAAGIEPDQVDYICAHGTGTPTNDATEVQAVRAVFGDRLPPLSSVKSMIGHTMGAASGFGAVACCAALDQGFLPPTATLRQVDDAFGPGVDAVPGRGRPATVRVAQNHGFAFGGNNVIVVLGEVA